MHTTPTRLATAIAAGLLLSALAHAGPLAATGNQTDCTVHEPIRILEDHGEFGFTWDDPVTGEEVYRPGSGVVAGDGTASNPYVIGSWCISGADSDPMGIAIGSCEFGTDGPNPESTGVILCGTTEHFVFANNTVNLWEHGRGVGNISPDTGAIEHTSHQNNTHQLTLDQAPGIVVEDNVVHGIDTTEMLLVSDSGIQGSADDALVEDNRLVGASTLVGLDGDGVRIADNELDSSGWAHVESRGDALEIVDNRMENTVFDGPPLWGIAFSGDGALVEGNHVDGHDWAGIQHDRGTGVEISHNHVTGDSTGISATDDVLVDNNTVEGGSTGVYVGSTVDGVRVENNTVTGADTGLNAGAGNDTWTHNDVSDYAEEGMHVDAENVTVRHTNFDDTNGTALHVGSDAKNVDARHNWWGCADGPDDPGCDDVVGDAVVEPWLTEPSGEAGAAG